MQFKIEIEFIEENNLVRRFSTQYHPVLQVIIQCRSIFQWNWLLILFFVCVQIRYRTQWKSRKRCCHSKKIIHDSACCGGNSFDAVAQATFLHVLDMLFQKLPSPNYNTVVASSTKVKWIQRACRRLFANGVLMILDRNEMTSSLRTAGLRLTGSQWEEISLFKLVQMTSHILTRLALKLPRRLSLPTWMKKKNQTMH